MRQLMFLGPGKLRFDDAPEPVLVDPRDALVRPLAVARCDLDAVFMTQPVSQGVRGFVGARAFDPAGFAISGDPPYAPPFPVGHECVAEIVALGDEVQHVEVGQRVVVSFPIACGGCATCDRGLTSRCDVGGREAVKYFGFGPEALHYGGMLSDLVRVPFADAMLVPLPNGVTPADAASASDNMPDAYRAVAGPLREMPGAPVLVMGGLASSVGLYAAGIARALGASRVDYCDHDLGRLAIAERLGARAIEAPRRTRLGRYRTLADSYLIGVDASSDTFGRGLELVLRSLEPGGICTSVGIYPLHRTPVPLMQMYLNGLTLRTGITNARALIPEVLALLEERRLDSSLVTTVLAPWSDAPEALATVATKVVVVREASA